MKYKIGIDLGNKGCLAITNGKDKVIDIIKYPKEEVDKQRIKEIDVKIKELLIQERSKTRIKAFKAEKNKINKRSIRDYSEIYNFLKRYDKMVEYAVIEEPIAQMSGGMTTSNTIAVINQSFGVYKAILSICNIPYKLYSPQEWQVFFDYRIEKGLTRDERRAKIKQESIRIASETFKNIDNFWIPKGHRVIDDNIVEASLLSIL